MELLAERVFGNPHSASPASHATTELVERARSAVLDYFQRAGRRIHRGLHAERHRAR